MANGMKFRKIKVPRASLVVGACIFGFLIFSYWIITRDGIPEAMPMTKEFVAELVRESVENASGTQAMPEQLEILFHNESQMAQIEYGVSASLQKEMQRLFKSYRPDYGAFVALNAKTGQVLSLVSYSRYGLKENLALRATFPSASVFKVVTAAAAVGGGKVSINTVIPYNGRSHTLYRGQVMQSKINHWTRYITLKQAFAQSINSVFGKLGAFSVGSESLREYAGLFGFNRKIAGDLPVSEGKALIPDDPWGLAESAAGFTQLNTMSPVQGALIAASVANGGIMMEPYIVKSLKGEDGVSLYQARPRVAGVVMEASTAQAMRSLMKETVRIGTSRGSFRGFFKNHLSDLDVGGKTGTLTGHDPQGKVDWFVGFADSGDDQIALAALTINRKQWRVKSSYLARRAFESYFLQIQREAALAAKARQLTSPSAALNEYPTRPNPG